jgi:hypothetical protein
MKAKRRAIQVAAKPIPEGHHTVTPSFALRDTRKAIEFYKGAEQFFASAQSKR